VGGQRDGSEVHNKNGYTNSHPNGDGFVDRV
jgi:hypothetical protein